jgi:hypothetical protein
VTVRQVDPERWRVQERMPFGGLPFRVWYSSRVRVEANGDVAGESRLFLGVRLHVVVSFEAVDAAPSSWSGYGPSHRGRWRHIRIAKRCKAHEEMLAAIRRPFEQLGGRGRRDELVP